MTEQILWLAIALMGVVIIGLIVAYSRQKKKAKESEDNLENARYISSEKTRMITERDTKLDIYETDKDILIDEVKRMEKLNDTNIVEIFELKSELSALKAKMPQQCGKCGKWTKPNPIIVEDKPMCQKCFSGYRKLVGFKDWAWEKVNEGLIVYHPDNKSYPTGDQLIYRKITVTNNTGWAKCHPELLGKTFIEQTCLTVKHDAIKVDSFDTFIKGCEIGWKIYDDAKRVEIETKQTEAPKPVEDNTHAIGDKVTGTELIVSLLKQGYSLKCKYGYTYYVRDNILYLQNIDGEERKSFDQLDRFHTGNEIMTIVSLPKPLDLSNVKPGTKVRLSNGVETVTVETTEIEQISIQNWANHFLGDEYATYFYFDGTAVNGSDIRIEEVVE